MDALPGQRLARALLGVLAVLLAVLALGSLSTAPVLAATRSADVPVPIPNNGPTTGADKTAVTWSLVPVGPAGLDGRTKYAYTAAPGSKLNDLMGISNFSLSPLRLLVYSTDAINVTGGAFGLIPDGQKPTDVGSWIGIKQALVTVPARSRVTVPFTMAIPANATPGDHVGGIVATAESTGAGPKNRKVVTNYRTGSRVYVRVIGDIKAALAVENVKASYANNWNPIGRGVTTVTYRIRNTGNTRLAGTQKVSVTSLFGTSADAPNLEALPELLPGNFVDLTATVPNVFPLGLLKAKVVVTPVVPAGVSTTGVSEATGSVSFWAIPWALLATILGALLLWQLDRWRQRRMRAKLAPKPDAPTITSSIDELMSS